MASRKRRELFERVEAYCMFIGHGRSGHSLTGALLNAHPDAVIAHELDAFLYLRYGLSRNQLYALLLERDQWFMRAAGAQWAGYSYAVPNQWQGRFRRLRIIGDKKGGTSSARLGDRPELLTKLRDLVRVPIRIVHVTRNPFDNIATISRRTETPLRSCVDEYFRLCKTNERILAECDPSETMTLRHEDFLKSPRAELLTLWRFLGADCSEDYLDDCASIVQTSPSRTRLRAEWTGELKRAIQDQILRYQFLEGYTFDS